MSHAGAIHNRSKALTPTFPDDHRKRRRSRTIQSCLNCHASKRMCNRKRPACQRCTALGLAGLCAYEADNPIQRNSVLDEKAILRNRVAELEGVIRELKKKPHPCLPSLPVGLPPQSTSPREDLSTSVHPVPRKLGGESLLTGAPPLVPEHLQTHLPRDRLGHLASPRSTSSSEGLLTPRDPTLLSPYGSPTATGLGTMDDFMSMNKGSVRSGVNMANRSNAYVNNIFSNFVDPLSYDKSISGYIPDHHIMAKDPMNVFNNGYSLHPFNSGRAGCSCGCCDDTTVYNSLLGLSLRLRKVAEALGRVSSQRTCSPGSTCNLYLKVRELDELATTTLGNALSTAYIDPPLGSYLDPPSSEVVVPTMSPYCQANIVPHLATNTSAVPALLARGNEDSFISWDGMQRAPWNPMPVLLSSLPV